MKYYGEPLCHVIDYERGKEVFCFDANGEFETDDPKLIAWMKKNKNFIRCEDNAKSDLIKCKKCEQTFINKGELMAHCRKEHKRE